MSVCLFVCLGVRPNLSHLKSNRDEIWNVPELWPRKCRGQTNFLIVWTAEELESFYIIVNILANFNPNVMKFKIYMPEILTLLLILFSVESHGVVINYTLFNYSNYKFFHKNEITIFLFSKVDPAIRIEKCSPPWLFKLDTVSEIMLSRTSRSTYSFKEQWGYWKQFTLLYVWIKIVVWSSELNLIINSLRDKRN